LALLIGVLAVLLGELIAGPAARLVAGGGGPVASNAELWLRIAILGLPGVLVVMAGNGWLRGVQDTRSPVRIVVVANALSAVASPLLVYPAGLGLAGSAVANVAAQWIAALLCLRAVRTERVSLRPDRAVMRSQLVVSRDLVIRALAFQLAYLTAAAVAGRMGAAQLAAHQVGLQLWEFIALLLDSFAIAAQSLVGAALGGGAVAAAKSTAWRVSRYGLVAGIAFGSLMAAGWYLIPALFSADAGVRQQAHVLWPWLVLMMPVAGVVFALDGVLLGAGDNAFVRDITVLATLGGYVPLSLLALRLDWGLGGVWAGLAAFITIRFVGMAWRTRTGRWLIVGEQR
jgi:putative MATE family efflux protein